MNATNNSIVDLKAEKAKRYLPADRVQAINALIKVTQDLVALSEREAQALAQDDMMSFHIMQDEKGFLATRYERLSAEFRERLEEFRGTDPALLDRLDKLQKTLGENTTNNNVIVASIRDRSQQNTQNALFTVQEMAQQRPLTLASADDGQNTQAGTTGV